MISTGPSLVRTAVDCSGVKDIAAASSNSAPGLSPQLASTCWETAKDRRREPTRSLDLLHIGRLAKMRARAQMCAYASIQQTHLSKLRTGRMPRGSPGQAVTRNTANMHKNEWPFGPSCSKTQPASPGGQRAPGRKRRRYAVITRPQAGGSATLTPPRALSYPYRYGPCRDPAGPQGCAAWNLTTHLANSSGKSARPWAFAAAAAVGLRKSWPPEWACRTR